MHKNIRLLGLATVACLHLAPLPVYAEDSGATANAGSELQEVIVTAERRSIICKSRAVRRRSAARAIAQRVTESAQVLQNVPGYRTEVTEGPSAGRAGQRRSANIAIRGLGAVAQHRAVAIYEDGVLQGGGANFYDMSRVEVLRGRGTLYGRGAAAGA
jgi:iron complex outermembrane receptor protein